MLDFIDSVTAKGNNKVTFKLKKAFPMLKQRLALFDPDHACLCNRRRPEEQPVGSGPWKYASITDQQIKFEKNDKYNISSAQTKNMVYGISAPMILPVLQLCRAVKQGCHGACTSNSIQDLERSGSENEDHRDSTRHSLCSTPGRSRLMTGVYASRSNAIDVNSFYQQPAAGPGRSRNSYSPKSFPTTIRRRTFIPRIFPRRSSCSAVFRCIRTDIHPVYY